MTDPELNKALALIIHPIEKLQFFDSGRIRVVLGELIDAHDIDAFGNAKYLDYCNNWGDLMPYVDQYRLIIVPYKDDLWEAYPEGGEFVIYNKKYLRAGAECLLKVLQGEQANEQ